MLNRMRATAFAILLLATASPAITIDTAVAQTQSSTKIASTVLATVNGQRFTQSMVNSAIELGEFLADHKFTAAEKRWIIDSEVKMFRNNPSEEIQTYKQIAQILSQIKQLRDPVQLAHYRETILANTYLSLVQNNHVNTPSVWTIVYKYAPVLYANPKYKMVVTKRTVDYTNASRNLVAKIAGKPLKKPNYEYWTRMTQQAEFKSPEVINRIATAESRSVAWQVAWSKASPRRRDNIIANIKSMQRNGGRMHHIARTLESEVPKLVSMDKIGQEARKSRRDFRVRNQIDRMNGGYERLWDGMFGR